MKIPVTFERTNKTYSKGDIVFVRSASQEEEKYFTAVLEEDTDPGNQRDKVHLRPIPKLENQIKDVLEVRMSRVTMPSSYSRTNGNWYRNEYGMDYWQRPGRARLFDPIAHWGADAENIDPLPMNEQDPQPENNDN